MNSLFQKQLHECIYTEPVQSIEHNFDTKFYYSKWL